VSDPPTLVVADASPLIALSRVGHLEILRVVYREIWVPPEVAREAFTVRAQVPPDWVKQRLPAAIPPRVAAAGLDDGEAQAIALAVEMHAALLLIDERAGRAVAQQMAVPIAGTAAVLARAKVRGAIPSVRPVLDALLAEGFRMSHAVYERALRLAGE